VAAFIRVVIGLRLNNLISRKLVQLIKIMHNIYRYYKQFKINKSNLCLRVHMLKKLL